MKLASGGRPWARGPQFYSLLLRLMGVVRSTLRSRHPAPLLPPKISLSPISLPFPILLHPSAFYKRYETVANLYASTISNLMRVGKVFYLLVLIKLSLSLSTFPTYIDGIIFFITFSQRVYVKIELYRGRTRERELIMFVQNEESGGETIRSRRDFGMVENKAKHGKVKVCCERNEGGNGDGARYPEAGARARTDKTR